MTKITSLAIAAAAGTALVLGSAAAFANNSSAANGTTITMVDTIEMLKADGYTQIDSIDRDVGSYDVEAVDPNGQRVEVTIDSASGKILRSERDD